MVLEELRISTMQIGELGQSNRLLYLQFTYIFFLLLYFCSILVLKNLLSNFTLFGGVEEATLEGQSFFISV